MTRALSRFFPILVLSLALPLTAAAQEEKPAEGADSKATAAQPKLSPEKQKLCDTVRGTLANHARQGFNLSTNSVTDILDYCYAAGIPATVIAADQQNRYNAMGCLCYNYPCGGFRPLALLNDLPTALVGYGRQARPGQMLATLALSGVKPTNAIKVEGKTFTIADLVKSEQLACRTGEDMSLRLIGLAFYCDDEANWTNSLGEKWNLQKVIESELDRKADKMTDDSIRRLTGLAFALGQRLQRNKPLAGVYDRLNKRIDEYHEYIYKLQNDNGSWSPYYFAYRGTDKNHYAALRSSGRMLEFLVMVAPDDKLDDPRLVKALGYACMALNMERYAGDYSSLPTAEIATIAHTLRAVKKYNDRAFPVEKKPENKETEKTTADQTPKE